MSKDLKSSVRKRAMDKLGIIGLGKWGSALRFAAKKAGSDVISWSRTQRNIEGFCPLDEVLGCKNIIISISAQHIDRFLSENFRFNGQNILVASKGIEVKNGRFLNEIYENFVPRENLVFLSGPSFAVEVMEAKPTALVLSGHGTGSMEAFLPYFPSFIKLYTSADVTGAEIAGAYKNVIAIAAGICDGLGLGNNARAALITRGLAEMTRFGISFGAKLETFLGLSGVGDLFLTATSEKSRNYRVGDGLSKGFSIDRILSNLGETAEGVETAKAVSKISKQKNIYTPIADEVSQILLGADLQGSIARLLMSTKREEF